MNRKTGERVDLPDGCKAYCLPIVFMPNEKPAPHVMLREEVAEFLRLNVRFPRATVDRMRKQQGLKSVQISRRVLFILPDVLDFIEQQKERNPR